jgi:hypothetical protein
MEILRCLSPMEVFVGGGCMSVDVPSIVRCVALLCPGDDSQTSLGFGDLMMKGVALWYWVLVLLR